MTHVADAKVKKRAADRKVAQDAAQAAAAKLANACAVCNDPYTNQDPEVNFTMCTDSVAF